MFRESLMTALKSAVGNYNAGSSDVDAVVKAAQAADFNPDQTQRLIEAYNTTKTISMFKVADDRTVSFSTADPEKVMSALFDGKSMTDQKADSAKAAGTPYAFDYSEYDQPEPGLSFDKAASVDEDNYGVKPSPKPLPSFDSIARAAGMAIDEARGSAEKCATDAGLFSEQYRRTLTKLAQELTQDLGEPDRTERALAWFKAAYPEQADPVIEDLRAFLPPTHADKQAADVRMSAFGLTHFEIDALFKEAIDLKLARAELTACAKEFDKLADDWRDEFNKIAGALPGQDTEDEEVGRLFAAGFLEKRGKSTYETVSTWDMLTGKEEPRKSTVESADPIGDLFQLGGKTVGTGVSAEVGKVLPKVVSGPEVRAERKSRDKLRNFQRQLMLEDLLSNDPVLQGVDPDVALRNYEALVRLAPELSMNKEVVRSVLRTAANAEALSPYDAKQMADVENVMRKTLALPTPGAQAPNVRVNV